MVFEIPTDAIDADYQQVTELDGSAYLFDFSWSDRSQSWYLSLYLQTDGESLPISEGMRLSPGWPLLMGVVADGRPPGDLFALDLNGQGDPGRTELGGRVKLYYFDPEALAPSV